MQQDNTVYEAIIIGAGPAGLAVGGSLVQRGLRPRLIEKGDAVGVSWRNHYERLHLHTVKALSALPGAAFPVDMPRYVPRQGVVDHLAAYAQRHAMAPEFAQEVTAIERDDAHWRVSSAAGRCWRARHVVVATGANHTPRQPALAGQASYGGRVLHSHAYRNALPFAGQRVLVVGMGNTGAEIALDLAEQGVRAALSVRSPVNIVYRDVLGRPTQLTSLALARLPRSWGDALAGWLRDLTVGSLERYGLQTPPISPLRQLREQGKTPVIDVGTLARIKRGDITVHPGIDRLTSSGVRFVDASEHDFDAIVLATGYEARLQRLFPGFPLPLDSTGLPADVVGQGPLHGVYFVGFDIRQPGGLLRAIGAQAQVVARLIAEQAITRAHVAAPP